MKCRCCFRSELTSGDFDGLCYTCRNLLNNQQSNIDIIKVKFDQFAQNQKSIPPEFIDIINKEFWNLI